MDRHTLMRADLDAIGGINGSGESRDVIGTITQCSVHDSQVRRSLHHPESSSFNLIIIVHELGQFLAPVARLVIAEVGVGWEPIGKDDKRRAVLAWRSLRRIRRDAAARANGHHRRQGRTPTGHASQIYAPIRSASQSPARSSVCSRAVFRLHCSGRGSFGEEADTNTTMANR